MNNMINDVLQRYLDRRQRRLHDLVTSTVVMPQEPRVSAREKTLVVPGSVWNDGQYGQIDDLIEYLRVVNQIPENAFLELEVDTDDFHTLRLHFKWWEIIIRHERTLGVPNN